ncbi:MAG TPA: VWA domain-containing protein [Planctomycetaceae bacterium]|nr:VWA domain-containing protein [Planctomycetaceae bacterium]
MSTQPDSSDRHTPGNRRHGGIIHTYQKYDAGRFPSPTQPPPDTVSPAFDHMLMFGSSRKLTEEELARAVRIDPSQIAGFGPSIDALIFLLQERKRKILERYETDTVQNLATGCFQDATNRTQPPQEFEDRFQRATQQQQLYDLERIWFDVRNDSSEFAQQLMRVIGHLGNKYEVEQLVADYTFSGQTPLTVSEALEVQAELQRIDDLLRQLEEARETAQIGLIDMEALAEFTEAAELEPLEQLQQVVEEMIREAAERQGLISDHGAMQLTPQAYRVFQGKLLERIFSQLQESNSGRHQDNVVGEGAVEIQQTKPYEFGDSVTQMDIPQSLINAMVRGGFPLRMRCDDIEIHKTRNRPKSATVVIMDMSGSMRYEGQYINVKRMALALDGLIRSEYPGDFLQFVEMYTFGKLCPAGQIIDLLPKPVTIHDPIVRLRADMSRDDMSELQIPPHFTNIQHSLQLARRLLTNVDTPNRQIVLITDGLPTAHFDDQWLYLLYPPDPLTEGATMREALACAREQITINLFLVPSWSQSEEDIHFAYRMAESTRGRVFFTGGRDLDRFVVWDYVAQKREILG